MQDEDWLLSPFYHRSSFSTCYKVKWGADQPDPVVFPVRIRLPNAKRIALVRGQVRHKPPMTRESWV
jgi:hypothetical protein